ncbi:MULTISPECIES: LysR family transcriptional regulator [unclassified Bradyrhizobium]|uniref:LysR family transcriptional regulator n=1 Tax=unclassified Bradyrhizobium TaxID=2631580 RepID=UPI001BA80B40|nr:MULTISPECIES: LysR substrate-binding domain-containing protein [unclassified Bradyrhizobium]MBR1226982.1 LysR family transcriptional regulator [Bradyrhizobium sp. AUGA SZCCT0176]MBR1296674.1 LysR family transcriptional regulator [Bradyrhizobium sp. AUGA SZCCT0042]
MMNKTDLSRADLNLLVLFEILMEERHAGRSAERLNLSPSAVSHGLGRLRKLLADPLFLRTPKGVVPTARASELAAPVAEILTRIRGVVSSSAPFDPARSTRRFVIGAPDGTSAVFLPPLLEALRKTAPGIDIGIRQILPTQGQPTPDLAWKEALADLEARDMDIAVIPFDDVPVRFHKQTLYEEEFVIAARAGHRFGKAPSLRNYCEMQHLVVSHTGDAYGFVDVELARQGLSRRVALTVPNFIFALGVLAETDLVSALPRRFVEMHGPRFGIVAAKAPIALPHFAINAILPKIAMMDAGVAWLVTELEQIKAPRTRKPKHSI